MANPVRVGIIGASAAGGWARDGHVPAVQALDGLEFVAVATNSQQTADAAVRAFGVPAATAGFGPDVPAPFVYLEDPANFVNLVTVQGAHTIDLAIAAVGALGDLSALATAQYSEIVADGERRRRITFDHLLVQGRLAQGGTLSAEVAGGRPPGRRSAWTSWARRAPCGWMAAPRAVSSRAA